MIMSGQMIFTIIFLVIALGAFIALKIRTTQINKNPELQELQRRREAEYYRKLNEQETIESLEEELRKENARYEE